MMTQIIKVVSTLALFSSALASGYGGELEASSAAAECPGHVYDGTWESLQAMPVPDWFEDGKIGIFIPWARTVLSIKLVSPDASFTFSVTSEWKASQIRYQ